MLLFSAKNTSRYKDAVRIQQKAEEKYIRVGYIKLVQLVTH
jgi:hypothetical protein